jgi:hypothetical protein
MQLTDSWELLTACADVSWDCMTWSNGNKKEGSQGDCVSQSSCPLADQALYQTAIPKKKKKGKSGRFGTVGRRMVFEDLLVCQVFFGKRRELSVRGKISCAKYFFEAVHEA